MMIMAMGASAFAAASPPDKFEAPITNTHPDLENDLAVFVNTSRDAYCTPEVIAFEEAVVAWLESGGAFPEEPAFTDGFELISGKTKVTGQGAVVASINARGLHIELWVLDAPEDRPFVGPCLDTDDANTMFGSGTSTLQGRDNDFDNSGTRGNSFGERGRANVSGDSGDYAYSWKFHLNSKCYTPEDGPPSCLLDTATLRAK